MNNRMALALAGSGPRALATALALVTVFVASQAPAQQPPPAQPPAPRQATPPRPAAPAQRPAPKPAQQPAQAPAPQPAAPPPQQAAADAPQLIYSPWTKFCNKAQEQSAKQVCFTGRDARTETGVPVVAAALIEPEGEPKKIFRVTLPSPLQLQYGTRIVIDQNQPLSSPFFTCFANGCMADYEGTPDLIGKLRKGQGMQVQAINLAGTQVTFPVPLNESAKPNEGFARANDGPPTDPKVFEMQQKKLQDELQKKADEARKKLEQQGQPPAAPSR